MKIDLTPQIECQLTLPLCPVRTYTGSALPLELVGIPEKFAGGIVAIVRVTIVNADGVPTTGNAIRIRDEWHILFASSNFAAYGQVIKGVKIAVVVTRDDGTAPSITVGVGDMIIDPATADAIPGDPISGLMHRGEDIYLPFETVSGVRHYKKQCIAYDPEMEGWGASWDGDYILVDGEFTPYNQPEV